MSSTPDEEQAPIPLARLGITAVPYDALSLILNTITVYCMWTWFVDGVFHTIHLSMIQAAGITVFIGYATSHFSWESASRDPVLVAERRSFMISAPLYFLVIALIIHGFMVLGVGR